MQLLNIIEIVNFKVPRFARNDKLSGRKYFRFLASLEMGVFTIMVLAQACPKG